MNSPKLTDDQLGTALGDSLRGRVDDVPTITPAFDGVERRARQMTNRRRALAGAAVGAFLLLAGIGVASVIDDDTALEDDVFTDDNDNPGTADPAPVDDTDDDVVDADPVDDPIDTAFDDDRLASVVTTGLTDEQFIRMTADETVEVLYTAGPGETLVDAVALADGSAVVEVYDDGVFIGRLIHVPADGADAVELPEFGVALGGAVVDDIPFAFVGDVTEFWPQPFDDRATGDLLRINLLTGEREVFVEDAFAIERSVTDVDVHDGVVLIATQTEGNVFWNLEYWDRTEPHPIDPGPANDARFSPRFDRATEGLLWLEFDGSRWDLVEGTLAGVETRRFEAVWEDPTLLSMVDLRVTDDLLVMNISEIPGRDEPLETTTIWGDPAAPSDAERFQYEIEAGTIGFVQPAETSNPAADPADAPADGSDAWRPLAELGLEIDPTAPFIAGELPLDQSLVAVIDGVVTVVTPEGDTIATVAGGDIRAARVTPDSVLIELGNEPTISTRSSATKVLQIRGDLYRVLSEDGILAGVADLGEPGIDDPYAFVADLPVFDGTPGSDAADLRMISLDRPEATVIGQNLVGLEWTVDEVFVGGAPGDEVLLVDGADLQPVWGYYDLAGNRLDLASPTDGRYGTDWARTIDGVGPDADRPALAADGSALYWIEIEADPPSLAVTAKLHVMDTATGEELPPFTIPLGQSEIMIHTDLTISGDQLLLTRWFDGGLDADNNLIRTWQAPIVIDPATGAWTELDLPGADWHFAG